MLQPHLPRPGQTTRVRLTTGREPHRLMMLSSSLHLPARPRRTFPTFCGSVFCAFTMATIRQTAITSTPMNTTANDACEFIMSLSAEFEKHPAYQPTALSAKCTTRHSAYVFSALIEKKSAKPTAMENRAISMP